MTQVILYLKKQIEKYSEDIAYIILVGFPSLILLIWLSRNMDFSNLY
ncbi:MAG TPA: hypothetical protein VIH57_09330 [Bacteroidales bacterium]